MRRSWCPDRTLLTTSWQCGFLVVPRAFIQKRIVLSCKSFCYFFLHSAIFFQPVCCSGFCFSLYLTYAPGLNFCLHQNCIEACACMLLHSLRRFFVLLQYQGYAILGIFLCLLQTKLFFIWSETTNNCQSQQEAGGRNIWSSPVKL